MIKDSDLGGFNSNRFDIPLLAEELLRAGYDFDLSKHKPVDAQTIFHKMEPRNLGAAYQFYCGKSLENAHSAEADTLATFEVLDAQVEKICRFCRMISAALSEFSFKINLQIWQDLSLLMIKKKKFLRSGNINTKVKDVFTKDLAISVGFKMISCFTMKKVLTKIQLRSKFWKLNIFQEIFTQWCKDFRECRVL